MVIIFLCTSQLNQWGCKEFNILKHLVEENVHVETSFVVYHQIKLGHFLEMLCGSVKNAAVILFIAILIL